MKRVAMNVITALWIALAFGAGAMAQQRITGSADITGYRADGVYDVSGQVKAQLLEKVVNPIKEKLSHMHNAQVEINIMGCATPTGGTITQNSAAGTQRAANAEGFLSKEFQQFPNVKFDQPWSNGSETKTRQVLVSWTISVLPAAPAYDRRVSAEKIAAVATAGIVIIILMYMFARLHARSKEAPVVPQIHLVSPAPKPRTVQKVIKVWRKAPGAWCDRCFSVAIIGTNVDTETERWDCPFPKPNKFRKSGDDIRNAAKSGLNRLSDAEVQQYLDEHLIKIAEQTKEEENVGA